MTHVGVRDAPGAQGNQGVVASMNFIPNQILKFLQ